MTSVLITFICLAATGLLWAALVLEPHLDRTYHTWEDPEC